MRKSDVKATPAPEPTTELIGVDEMADLRAMPTEQLRRELAAALGRTAAGFLRMAQIVRILEERGEDLEDLRIGLLPYLRRIAYGQVLPEVVVRFGEVPILVQHIGALPIPDQRRLADGEPITLVVRREDGHIDLRQADPLKLTRDQIHQVFGRTGLRDQAEQILRLEDKKAKTAKGTASKLGRITVDRKRNGLVIGRTFFPAAVIVEALAALGGDGEAEESEDDGGRTKQLVVPLTDSEHYALSDAALRGRTKMARLARRALHAAGLLSGRGEP